MSTSLIILVMKVYQEVLQLTSHLTGVRRNPRVACSTQESQEYIPEH